MPKVTTNDLDSKKVCTYMEVLKQTRDKLNEVIDVINRSNLIPTYHYNFYLEIETDTSIVCFDIYSHKLVDAESIGEFLENWIENFDVSASGVLNSKNIYEVSWDKETEKLIFYSNDTTQELTVLDIADSEIIVKEI